ncbi:hypothetical protein FRC17_005489 [Serendipita sp. 399]|nr:hypothetical protein FRC17_005489 [Serendipita sp. 399]
MARTSRKRKVPITVPVNSNRASPSSSLPVSASSKVTKGVIRRFHSLQKEKSRLLRKEKTSSSLVRTNPVSKSQRTGDFDRHGETDDGYMDTIRKIDDELAKLGGLERYQAMSAIGQSHLKGGGSERVLIQWLKEIIEDDNGRDKHQIRRENGVQRMESVQKEPKKRRLLDVGALKHDNYAKASALVEVTAMDLHSRHPSIIERDFLTISPGNSNDLLGCEPWDVISLSLVLNFLPDPKERGRMLQLAHDLLEMDGLLFVVVSIAHRFVSL